MTPPTEAYLELAATCAACGASGVQEHCGRSWQSRTRAPGSLGATVELSSGTKGVLLDWHGDDLSVLTPDGRVSSTYAELKSATPLPQTPTSPLGAIRRAQRSVHDAELASAVAHYVADAATETDSWHEVLAETLMSAPEQMEADTQRTNLGPHERVWWCLLAADKLSDSAAVLRWSAALPRSGYEERLLIWARDLNRPDTDLNTLAQLVQMFDPMTPQATELLQHLHAELGLSPSTSGVADLPTNDVNLILKALDNDPLPDDRQDLLEDIDPPLLDDLIDAGSVPLAWLSTAGTHRDHLALRLDPSQASLEAVLEHGPLDEILRRLRAMPSPEREAALAHLDDATAREMRLRSSLSSSDADVAFNALTELLQNDPARLSALQQFREGTGRATTELLEHPDTRAVILRHGAVDRIPTDVLDDASRDLLARRSLRTAKDALHDWDFDTAASASRTVLASTSHERLRDEALNTIAASRLLSGDAAGAVAALRKALEGDYTLPLQTNLVAAAHGLATEEEAEVLAQLMHEAPTAELRVEAARRGLTTWVADDDAPDLPRSLRDGLRALLLKQPLDEDALILFLRILTRFDERWVRTEANRNKLARANRPAFDVFRAQAAGDGQALLQALGKAQPAAWANEIVADLARDLVDRLGEEDEDKPLGFAMELLGSNVRLEAVHEIFVTSALVFPVARAVMGEGEPNVEFVDYAEHARKRLSEVGQEHRDGLREMLDEGSDALTVAFLANREQNLNDLIDGVNEIAGIPRYQLNRAEASSFLDMSRRWTTDTESLLNRLSRIAANPELRDAIRGIKSEALRLRQHINGMRV